MYEKFSPVLVFLSILIPSISLSVYFWFVKNQRTGPLIWFFYVVRAFCGLFAVGVAVIAWNILIEGADALSVLAFAGPIGLAGVIIATPWGSLKKISIDQPGR